MNSDQNKIFFPIYFLLSWLSLTILTFAFGPYKYQLTNSFVFYTYLLLIHISLYLGYFWGQKSTGRGTRIKIDYYRFVRITIIISLIYYFIKLVLTSGGDLRNFTETFKNASKTYYNSSFRRPNLFSYFDIIFGPISVIAITNGIFSGKNLPKLYKYSALLLIILSIGSAIGSGTRSGIVQIAMLSFAAFLLGIYRKNIILQYYDKVLIYICAAVFIIGFFTYSSIIVTERGGIVTVNPLSNELPRENYFLFKITSSKLHPQIVNTSFYISHSYYQLNRAMNLPLLGIGFGLSNSFFIMDNIEQLTGSTWLKDISYGMRIDKTNGTGFYGSYWSTFYTWIASDVTFPGTIFVIFFIGFFFSIALRDSLFSLNPFAVTVFCTFFYFIFHFAFNNPLQDGQGITTFFCLPVVWLLLRENNK
jgi:hypothetical protein